MTTPTIQKGDKNYFVEYDKVGGGVYVTQCVPEPTEEQLLRYAIEDLSRFEIPDSFEELRTMWVDEPDHHLETYDFISSKEFMQWWHK